MTCVCGETDSAHWHGCPLALGSEPCPCYGCAPSWVNGMWTCKCIEHPYKGTKKNSLDIVKCGGCGEVQPEEGRP